MRYRVSRLTWLTFLSFLCVCAGTQEWFGISASDFAVNDRSFQSQATFSRLARATMIWKTACRVQNLGEDANSPGDWRRRSTSLTCRKDLSEVAEPTLPI